MNAGTAQQEEPSVAGVRVRPVWSMVLYGLLVSAAGVALYAQRSPAVDPSIARLSPWLFLVFALGFAIYRVALVAARRYSPFKAFIQIFLAALFFMLLLAPEAPLGPRRGDSLAGHPDARVRALQAEVTGLRGDASAAPSLVNALRDGDAAVREAAHGALVKLNAGLDLGPADDAAAREAWGKRFP
jgi:hypothetical protein